MSSDKPTFADDIDQVMRLGYGRRMLGRIVAMGAVENAYSSNPQDTAYNLGLVETSRKLDALMREVNPEAWLILQREMISEETDGDS